MRTPANFCVSRLWHDKAVVLGFRRKKEAPEADARSGVARVDPRTKNLTKRLRPGDVAIIDHVDIDRVSAEALVECKPSVVVNAAPSTSGRYPNLGPGILNRSGIPLVDGCGSAVMEVREGMNIQLKAFASNTMEYVEREQDLIFDGVGVPDVRTKFEGRHVLVVVRGYRYKEDLATLRPYIREYRPIMIGVDGGADAILEEGYKLDMIVGDMDSVSDRALTSGAEIVVHAYRDGKAPGQKRVEDLNVPHVVFPCTGTSEDVAMLLADDKHAKIIVALGTHNTLIEFLDKGRKGMASTFLTRLAVGGKLIDAKGVSQLYRSRISSWQILSLILAGCVAIAAAMASTATGRATFGLISAWFADIAHWFGSLL